jgi:hypothetical protein
MAYAGNKQKSASSPKMAKGGSGKMAGKQSAGPQKPGTSNPAMGSGGGMFMKGGKGKMAGKQTAGPAKSC